MVVGLVRPESGYVWLDKHDITRRPMYQRARDGIGYLPPGAVHLPEALGGRDLLLPLEQSRLSFREQRARVESLLEEFNLGPVRKQKGFSLSGGERRRVEIARVMALRPAFLLLDEPFTSIDPIEVKHSIRQTVAHLKSRNIGILEITDHNVQATLLSTDVTYIVKSGRIMTHGTPHRIAADRIARQEFWGRLPPPIEILDRYIIREPDRALLVRVRPVRDRARQRRVPLQAHRLHRPWRAIPGGGRGLLGLRIVIVSVITLPMAMLLATLLALGRLSSESGTGGDPGRRGFRYLRVSYGAIAFGLAVSIAGFVINERLVPPAGRRSAMIEEMIMTDLPERVDRRDRRRQGLCDPGLRRSPTRPRRDRAGVRCQRAGPVKQVNYLQIIGRAAQSRRGGRRSAVDQQQPVAGHQRADPRHRAGQSGGRKVRVEGDPGGPRSGS